MPELRPTITIITAVYNGGRYLEQAINSVARQSYPKIQYIVIDGGSTDNTVDVIQNNKDKIGFWISEKDSGVYDAWNKGLEHAIGDWIVFLGADDYFWDDSTVESIIPDLIYAESNQLPYVYGKIRLVSVSGEPIDTLGRPWEESRKKFFDHMTLTHCASFHHRSLFITYGKFDPQFRIAGDYEFLLRVFNDGKNAFFSNTLLAAMRAGGLSANIRLRTVLIKEDMLARKLNGIPSGFIHRLRLLKARMSLLVLSIFGVRILNRVSDMLRTLKGRKKLWSRID